MAKLRWEPCPMEHARVTYYSSRLTWSLGIFKFTDIEK